MINLSQEDIRKIAEALNQVPYMESYEQRKLLVSAIGPPVSESVNLTGKRKSDCFAIVQSCTHHDYGIDKLLEALSFFDESVYFSQLEKTIVNVCQKNLTKQKFKDSADNALPPNYISKNSNNSIEKPIESFDSKKANSVISTKEQKKMPITTIILGIGVLFGLSIFAYVNYTRLNKKVVNYLSPSPLECTRLKTVGDSRLRVEMRAAASEIVAMYAETQDDISKLKDFVGSICSEDSDSTNSNAATVFSIPSSSECVRLLTTSDSHLRVEMQAAFSEIVAMYVETQEDVSKLKQFVKLVCMEEQT